MLGDAAEQRKDLNPLIDPESFVILASEFNHPSVSALKPPIAWNVAAFNRRSRANADNSRIGSSPVASTSSLSARSQWRLTSFAITVGLSRLGSSSAKQLPEPPTRPWREIPSERRVIA
jgi:hypothetical protein